MEFDTEKFIRLVQERPILYLQSHADYRNAMKKKIAWTEIKDIIQTDVETCKVKWRNLKDSYIKSKQSTKPKCGQAAKKYLNWVWHRHMEFLDQANNPNYISNSLHTEEQIIDQPTTDQSWEIVPTEQCITELLQATPNKNRVQVKKEFRRKLRRLEDPSDRVIKFLESRKPKNPSLVEVSCDRVDLEFLGFANSFKRLSMRLQALVKLEITKILTDAELSEIDKALEENRDPLTEESS